MKKETIAFGLFVLIVMAMIIAVTYNIHTYGLDSYAAYSRY